MSHRTQNIYEGSQNAVMSKEKTPGSEIQNITESEVQ